MNNSRRYDIWVYTAVEAPAVPGLLLWREVSGDERELVKGPERGLTPFRSLNCVHNFTQIL